MTDQEYVRIIGTLQAHQEHEMRRLDSIEKKIDALQYFKWKAIGYSTGVSAAVSAMLTVVIGFFKYRH